MPGRLDEQPAQERLRRVRELEQLEDGQDPEHRARAPRTSPTAATAEPARRRRRGDPQLEDAAEVARRRAARTIETTSALTTKTASAGLDEDLEPVAAADRDDAGHPAEEDVGRELERAAVHGAADDRDDGDHDDRDATRRAGSRGASRSRPVGRKNGSARAAGGELERERRADDAAARCRSRTLLRCQSVGRKRQIQASSSPTTSTASRNQPPKLRDVEAAPRGARSASIFSMSVASISGRRSGRSTSPWRIVTVTGATASAAWSRACVWSGRAERASWRRRAGAMSSAASIRSASSRLAGHPARPGRSASSATSVSRSSVRSGRVEDARGLGPDGRPAGRRRAPTSVARSPRRTGRAGRRRAAILRASALRSAEKVVSIGATLLLERATCWAARSRSRSRVVKSYCGGDGGAGRAPAPCVGLDLCSRSRPRAARRCRGARAGPTATSSGCCGQDVERRGSPSARAIEDRRPRSRAAATSRRVKRRRGLVDALGQHGRCHPGRRRLSASRCRGRRGRRGRGPGRRAR